MYGRRSDRELAADHFHQLLIEQVGWQQNLDGLGLESIEPQDVSWLDRHFEENEI